MEGKTKKEKKLHEKKKERESRERRQGHCRLYPSTCRVPLCIPGTM